MRRCAAGMILITVLYLGVVIWGFLAALLLLALMQHRIAIVTRQHVVAGLLIDARLRELREAAPAAWPENGAEESGEVGSCTWSLAVLDRAPSLLRVRVRATVDLSRLTRDATIHAPP
jgi:type II secretory pathway pseudopilin PulG